MEFLAQIQNEQSMKLYDLQKEDLEQHRMYVNLMVDGEQSQKQINLIIKTNDYGTLETLSSQIQKISFQEKDVAINLIQTGVGQISETDIHNAQISNSVILAMDTDISAEALRLSKVAKVQIKNYRIIYPLIDEIKNLINQYQNKIAPKQADVTSIGNAVIQNIFNLQLPKGKSNYWNINKNSLLFSLTGGSKVVAGCKVTQGQINKNYTVRIMRDNVEIARDIKLANLKHFQKEVDEIKQDEECGIILFQFTDFKAGDIIESYEIKKK